MVCNIKCIQTFMIICDMFIKFHKAFLNQVWPPAAHAWFIEIALVHMSVCVSVCVSALEGINYQWRDMVSYRPCTIG